MDTIAAEIKENIKNGIINKEKIDIIFRRWKNSPERQEAIVEKNKIDQDIRVTPELLKERFNF